LNHGVNNDWEERWKDIVSKDFDYDSDFLVKLITHKLKLMLSYFSEVTNDTFENEASRDVILKSLEDCYNLGTKILNFNYGELADKFMADNGGDVGLWLFSNTATKQRLEELSYKATSDRAKDIKNFFMELGKYAPILWG